MTGSAAGCSCFHSGGCLGVDSGPCCLIAGLIASHRCLLMLKGVSAWRNSGDPCLGLACSTRIGASDAKFWAPSFLELRSVLPK